MSDQPVLFSVEAIADTGKSIAFIHLNAEKSFNALTLPMVKLMQPKLDEWAQDDSIAAVFMDGEGEKAFCSGGDVKGLFNGRIDGEQGIENPSAVDFFDQEYTLDYTLHQFPKPIICWGHGIVMGGGLGLMAGCSHRVVTERSRSAMPEITIALFPDVGGSWFLNRMPGRVGLFLGLTGANINAHDAIYSGLANCFIKNELKNDVVKALLAFEGELTEANLTDLLSSFEKQSNADLPESELKQHFDFIQGVTDFEALSDIVDAITRQCSERTSEWLKRAGVTLQNGCPLTAHIIQQQLIRGKELSLAEIFNMERKISARCMQQPDFYEGVRALLVDKDKSPVWSHADVSSVPADLLNSFFE